jgi:hypothetical protein
MWKAPLFLVSAAAWAACVVHADDDYDCGSRESFDCYLEYSPGYGYSRVCDLVIEPAVCIDFDPDEPPPPPRYRSPSNGGDTNVNPPTSGSGGSGAGGSGPYSSGGSGGAEVDEFDFPCERDAQCGTGLCIDGDCFYACEDDSGCGTADHCTLIDGTSVCQADEFPAEEDVECTRSADCSYEQVCMNASCHDSCSVTSDCTNELDRCLAGVCVPDRRVVSECLLDRECPDGNACVDATCVEL